MHGGSDGIGSASRGYRLLGQSRLHAPRECCSDTVHTDEEPASGWGLPSGLYLGRTRRELCGRSPSAPGRRCRRAGAASQAWTTSSTDLAGAEENHLPCDPAAGMPASSCWPSRAAGRPARRTSTPTAGGVKPITPVGENGGPQQLETPHHRRHSSHQGSPKWSQDPSWRGSRTKPDSGSEVPGNHAGTAIGSLPVIRDFGRQEWLPAARAGNQSKREDLLPESVGDAPRHGHLPTSEAHARDFLPLAGCHCPKAEPARRPARPHQDAVGRARHHRAYGVSRSCGCQQ